MDRNKKLKREFFNNYQKMLNYLKKYYKNCNYDMDYFSVESCNYDNLTTDKRKILEMIVFNEEEFFKFVNKCKINAKLVEYYDLEKEFTKNEYEAYIDYISILKDFHFSRKFKINLMKQLIIRSPKKGNKQENNPTNDYEHDYDA